jgi:hypothetical protein
MTGADTDRNEESLLPYRDEKPVGAADFYFAIHATFRFLLERFGLGGLQEYWTDLGRDYRAPVARTWKRLGLAGVARYWREFFAAEPGAEVEVTERPGSVVVDVKVCPAIRHLRASGRELLPCFCQHCYFAGNATAQAAGMALRVEGGNGSCRQTIFAAASEAPPQDLNAIREAR